jgi:hypothetical protein
MAGKYLEGGITKWKVNFNNPLIEGAHTPPRGRAYGEGIAFYRDEAGDMSTSSDNFIGTFSRDSREYLGDIQ